MFYPSFLMPYPSFDTQISDEEIQLIDLFLRKCAANDASRCRFCNNKRQL